MRFVCRSILYQPMKHYIHKLSTLREEFLCSLYGRIMKMRIDYAFKRQLLQYRSDMVLHPQNSSDKGDIKTFIPKKNYQEVHHNGKIYKTTRFY